MKQYTCVYLLNMFGIYEDFGDNGDHFKRFILSLLLTIVTDDDDDGDDDGSCVFEDRFLNNIDNAYTKNVHFWNLVTILHFYYYLLLTNVKFNNKSVDYH